jgi:hypothetical protein
VSRWSFQLVYFFSNDSGPSCLLVNFVNSMGNLRWCFIESKAFELAGRAGLQC